MKKTFLKYLELIVINVALSSTLSLVVCDEIRYSYVVAFLVGAVIGEIFFSYLKNRKTTTK